MDLRGNQQVYSNHAIPRISLTSIHKTHRIVVLTLEQASNQIQLHSGCTRESPPELPAEGSKEAEGREAEGSRETDGEAEGTGEAVTVPTRDAQSSDNASFIFQGVAVFLQDKRTKLAKDTK